MGIAEGDAVARRFIVEKRPRRAKAMEDAAVWTLWRAESARRLAANSCPQETLRRRDVLPVTETVPGGKRSQGSKGRGGRTALPVATGVRLFAQPADARLSANSHRHVAGFAADPTPTARLRQSRRGSRIGFSRPLVAPRWCPASSGLHWISTRQVRPRQTKLIPAQDVVQDESQNLAR